MTSHTSTHIWLIQVRRDSFVPTNGQELTLLQDVHDPCDLCVPVTRHVFETAAVGTVPNLAS